MDTDKIHWQMLRHQAAAEGIDITTWEEAKENSRPVERQRTQYTCTNCADGPEAEVTVTIVGQDIHAVECPECGDDMTMLQELPPRISDR